MGFYSLAIPPGCRMKNPWSLLLILMLGISFRLAAQVPDFKDTFTYFDVDGDGSPDFALVRSEASFQYAPSFPDSDSPQYWLARWYLVPLGTTRLIQFDTPVQPGMVVRGTDGEGQAETSSLLLFNAGWLKKNTSLGPGPTNFATGPLIDAQVRGLGAYFAGIRLGTNTPPRTGWIQVPTGYFPFTTNWPKVFLGTFSPPFWSVSVAETRLAPGTNTSIRIGSPADTALRMKRRATNLLVEIPDAAAASRLESATTPFGPWSPAASGWDLTVTLPVESPGGVPQARYFRVRPQ